MGPNVNWLTENVLLVFRLSLQDQLLPSRNLLTRKCVCPILVSVYTGGGRVSEMASTIHLLCEQYREQLKELTDQLSILICSVEKHGWSCLRTSGQSWFSWVSILCFSFSFFLFGSKHIVAGSHAFIARSMPLYGSGRRMPPKKIWRNWKYFWLIVHVYHKNLGELKGHLRWKSSCDIL